MIIETKFTYKDLRDTPDDFRRYEIIEGDLIVTPSPSSAHQIVSMNLERILSNYANEYKPGRLLHAPLDVYFDEETVVQPDILFIPSERLHIIEKQKINGAPDVVIEILSESTRSRDRGIKFNLYAKEGVKEYWMVDPDDRTIEIYEMAKKGSTLVGKYQGDDTVNSAYFKELRFRTSDVWK